jgi:hypothetical protein
MSATPVDHGQVGVDPADVGVSSATGYEELILLFALAGSYCLVGYIVEAAFSLPERMRNVWFEGTYLVYPALVLLSFPFAFAAHRWSIRDRDGRWIPGLAGWRAAWSGEGGRFITPTRAAGIVIVAVLTPFFLNTYGSWKSMIPDLQPFAWDARISSLDRILHFGKLPHEWLQPLLGHPVITRTIDVLYILWLPVNGAVLVWQGWSTRLQLRAQFFATYFLVYILLGTVLAISLSAAGPCYYGALVVPQSPYAPLMDYLGRLSAEQPIIALRVQETLWRNYSAGLNLPFVGISAMPSVHVAVAVLFGILGWRTSRWLGWAFTIYALIVLVGSIHLGWHYAADGYVSALLVPVLWVATGRLLHERAKGLVRSSG